MSKQGKIEISAPVDLYATVAFWVDREQWAKMTDDQKMAMTEEALDRVNSRLQNALTVDDETYVAMGLMDQEPLLPKDLEVYDPDEDD